MPTLSEIMTSEVVYLLPDESVTKAAREMKQLNVGVIPVCDQEQRVLGVVTDRDIVLRVVAEGRNPDETRIRDIATMDPIAGQPSWDVAEAIDLMSRNQIRRLPIVEDGKLIGIVSLGDISVRANQMGAGTALEQISEPSMPRRGAIDETDQTA
ncbi:MAG: CBS domain-containing protein [Ardenticatenaceae bacterium]